MLNLVIGNTSQLAHYFPKDYIKIPSRNIDFEYLRDYNWDSVYIVFSEQRIYDKGIDYLTPNYIYTLQIIQSLLNNSKKIVCYGSSEIWSKCSGYVSIDTEPNFDLKNEYTISKLLLWNKIKELRQVDERYNKVIFIHPFYFNSIYRSQYFLFGKIFDSIINKKRIEVSCLHIYRDIVHAKLVVEKSIEAAKDMVVGSGKLFNIRDFVKDLYYSNGLKFEDLVKEEKSTYNQNKLIMAKVDWDYTYQNLLDDSLREIKL